MQLQQQLRKILKEFAPKPTGGVFVWCDDKLHWEDACNGVVDEVGTSETRSRMLYEMALCVYRSRTAIQGLLNWVSCPPAGEAGYDDYLAAVKVLNRSPETSMPDDQAAYVRIPTPVQDTFTIRQNALKTLKPEMRVKLGEGEFNSLPVYQFDQLPDVNWKADDRVRSKLEHKWVLVERYSSGTESIDLSIRYIDLDVSEADLLKKLQDAAVQGLDCSPGDPLAARAYQVLEVCLRMINILRKQVGGEQIYEVVQNVQDRLQLTTERKVKGELYDTICQREKIDGDILGHIDRLKGKYKKFEENIEELFKDPRLTVVRCREGNGPEDLAGSLVLTVMRLLSEHEQAQHDVQFLQRRCEDLNQTTDSNTWRLLIEKALKDLGVNTACVDFSTNSRTWSRSDLATDLAAKLMPPRLEPTDPLYVTHAQFNELRAEFAKLKTNIELKLF